jgi:hypothetical protein
MSKPPLNTSDFAHSHSIHIPNPTPPPQKSTQNHLISPVNPFLSLHLPPNSHQFFNKIIKKKKIQKKKKKKKMSKPPLNTSDFDVSHSIHIPIHTLPPRFRTQNYLIPSANPFSAAPPAPSPTSSSPLAASLCTN